MSSKFSGHGKRRKIITDDDQVSTVSHNMVATLSHDKEETKRTYPRLPELIHNWPEFHDEFNSKCKAEGIEKILTGTYEIPEFYPKIKTIRFQRQQTVPGTDDVDLHGNVIYVKDAEGKRVIENEGWLETDQRNYDAKEHAQLMKIYDQKEKERIRLNEKAWGALMEITSKIHRSCLTPHKASTDSSEAWAAITMIYEGHSDSDRRLAIDIAKDEIINRLPKHTAKSPTSKQIREIISSIAEVKRRWQYCEPPINMTQEELQSIFIRSMPTCCNKELRMYHIGKPTITYEELTQAFYESVLAEENKDLEITKRSQGSLEVDVENSLYSQYQGGRGGRGGRNGRGRGRGRGRGNGGREGKDREFQGICYHCRKPGHRKSECRKFLAEKASGGGSAAILGTEANTPAVTQTTTQAVTQATTLVASGSGFMPHSIC